MLVLLTEFAWKTFYSHQLAKRESMEENLQRATKIAEATGGGILLY
jgi:hypothetical protein